MSRASRCRGRGAWAMLVGLGLATIADPVAAVEQPAHLVGRPQLELAGGATVRAGRELSWYHTPRSAAAAWSAFSAEVGPNMTAVWDRATGVPTRIWGQGIEAQGSMGSPAVAEAFARGLLERHIALLAPGAAASDFTLVSNVLSGGMRSIGFLQHVRGLRVLGGQVSFRFKNDRMFMIGSEALPRAKAAALTASVSDGSAAAAARSWVLSDSATVATPSAVTGPFVLPLIATTSVSYATVLRVVVEADAPVGRWDVYVNASTGAPVAREQTLRFASGAVRYNVPQRWPGDSRADYSASFAQLQVGGSAVTSDVAGVVSWSSGDTTVGVGVRGDQVDIDNAAGGQVAGSLQLSDGGSVVWDESGHEYTDAQLAVFTHTNVAVNRSRVFADDLPHLDTQMPANVNIANTCNAFFDGASINFFRSGGGCGNTGLIADIVYHEYGHSLHAAAIIEGVGAWGDGSLGEGVADYLSATITSDSGVGRGFRLDAEPLREIDPPNKEHKWPDDIGEIHHTGLIIGGALWDMRKALVDELGESDGVLVSDKIYYESLRRAVDIPTMYFEALAADDDDGDLANGTPHICAINQGFTPHGLRKIAAQATTLAVAPPHQESYKVTLGLIGLHAECPSDQNNSAVLTWRLRAQPEVGGSLPMAMVGAAFEAEIPEQPDGAVVQYQVELTFEDGSTIIYPDNAADPFYELFVGHVEPIYCTDFESDPEAEGWSHGLSSGQPGEGADDWMWGEPQAPSDSGDPRTALSGDKVYGNDLGGGNYNGQYQSDKTNYADSPVVDVSAYEVVRLQYHRWLGVEDGHHDQATIYANGTAAWMNLDSDQGNSSTTHHVDREWRFHDVDMTPHVVDGNVALKFEIATDGGGTFGGWTLDDLCLVGFVPTVCGDGLITGLEACDDAESNSDTIADACRSDCTLAGCGDSVLDSGEDCDDGNLVDGDGCEADCTPTPEEPPPDGDPDGVAAADDGDGGCSCAAVGRGSQRHASWLVAALGVGLLLLRRRRAAR